MSGINQRLGLAWLALIVFSLIIQFSALRSNPPGFFIDESSIAYNAHAIATTGRDEHHESWPLFFRAFGEYKNPIYIYLLAIVFRLTGPGILSARVLSALAGLATAVTLFALATGITGRRIVGLLIGIIALLTPWLFELSRLVMEVAIYPFAVAIFLVAIWHAARKPKWQPADILGVALTLGVLTYSYSVGRLLGPLFALGLVIFIKRTRWLSIVLTWFAYFVTLVPLLIFNHRHPSALTGRFKFITYVTTGSSLIETTRELLKHFFLNVNAWRLFVTESSNVNEIAHIPGPPVMLTITGVLILASLFLLFRLRRFNAWWCFVIYGAVVSVIPASLTTDSFHMLRLAALPIFLLVLTIPALDWITESDLVWKRVALVITILLITSQGLLFQWHYRQSARSPRRLHLFDADYTTTILPTALTNSGTQPVYLADDSSRPGYIQALWYGTLQGIPLNKFVSLGSDRSPPEGAVVITTEEICPRCRILAASDPYTTYIAQGPAPVLIRLPDEQMRAELGVTNPLLTVRPGQRVTIKVSVKNASRFVWRASDRSGSGLGLSVGNHWLDGNGEVVASDDGRTLLTTDLNPGQMVQVPLTISVPLRSGTYLLEIDLLQESVSWFGPKGSHTWRGPVLVTN
ncbi:MAG TPA: glycosyltransferase family 39 protein [Pyrinomonadaceae bacterium]|nr:glycosyltransferase family 39 protein [Pyrinomonadaceae bacterium]